MEIRKNKKGDTVYRGKVYLTDGKPITKTFYRKSDAKTWEYSAKNDIKRNLALGVEPLREDISFSKIFHLWWDRKILGLKSPKTVNEYRSIAIKHLLPTLGESSIRKINRGHTDIVVNNLKRNNLSHRTINKVVGIFKQIMSYAEIEGYISKNCLRGFPMLKQKTGRLDYLTQQEILQLLRSNAHEGIYPLLLVALNTGMRIGELTALCWDRLNFETDTIEVSRTIVQGQRQDSTKSNRVRYIPMNHEVRELFQRLMRSQKCNTFVFVDEKGKHFNPDHFSKRHFTKALQRAGVRLVSFHVLRHTYASQFMMNGGNIYDLQKILGHSSVQITMIYAHLSPQHMRKAVDTVRFSADGDNSCSPILAPSPKEGEVFRIQSV